MGEAGATASTEITVRRAGPEDRPAVVELCRSALGWDGGGRDEAFFSWKHDDNAFGASPIWVAEEQGRIVGVRVFLRWRWISPSGVVDTAVRAVDTATHPDMQGRGIFRLLTMAAVEELIEGGVGFVFNTPNEKSRPGYLKMGWRDVGRPAASVRLRSPMVAARLRSSKVGASKWSEATDAGMESVALFDSDPDGLERLITRCAPSGVWHTDRSVAYLRWRYSFEHLRYRALPLGDRMEDGLLVFRLRRRGDAVEAAVVEELVPQGSATLARRAAGYLQRRTGADYLLRIGGPSVDTAGFVRLPGGGPIVTTRDLAHRAPDRVERFGCSLGDLELF